MVPRFFKSFKFSTIFSKNSVSLCLKNVFLIISSNLFHWSMKMIAIDANTVFITKQATEFYPKGDRWFTKIWAQYHCMWNSQHTLDHFVIVLLSVLSLFCILRTRLDSTLCHLNTKGIFLKEHFAYVHNNVSVCVRYNRNGPMKCCSICR